MSHWNRHRPMQPGGGRAPLLRLAFAAIAAAGIAAAPGCASTQYVTVRKVPSSPLAGPLNLLSPSGPKPTERTQQLLRRYDLEKDPENTLIRLQQIAAEEPTPEVICGLAELSFVGAKHAQRRGDLSLALDLYAAAVTHAYLYLFDESFDPHRNPYDPDFRRACDLYNGALEEAMRLVHKKNGLRPGSTQTIETGNLQFDLTVAVRGGWRAEDIDHFEFVSDYEVSGLKNHYHTFGLGVPLIAVRKQSANDDPRGKYYPPNLAFPVTAFLRVCPPQQTPTGEAGRYACVLELLDPLDAAEIEVAGRLVPLETNLSTPLAYFLNQPMFAGNALATAGLLNVDVGREVKGLYMLEPFNPRKVPVLMVHGLWSSPITWMEMFNDLRAQRQIRENYQFWFYLYPTGQPFWQSAADLREDLAEARRDLDPEQKALSLDQMVLVGHSMGGLVSRMQTYDSGDDYWRLVSHQSPESLRGDPADREQLLRAVFFKPNHSVRRVVTLGTPHRGSDFANDYTQWLARSLIALPKRLRLVQERIARDNPGVFHDTQLLSISTSIDSLSPKSPLFPVMLNSRRPVWVKYHNVIGVVPDEGFLHRLAGRVAGRGDGIVAYESARMDDVESELIVPADHLTVHQHPQAVLEVRRILLDHLNLLRYEYVTGTDPRHAGQPVSYIRPAGAAD